MSARAEEILKRRAKALAENDDQALRAGHPLTLFVRGGMLLGLRVGEIAGAGTLKALTPIPGAPPWMKGAVFHRGEVLTLIDLVPFWGLELRGIADLPTFVVLSDGRSKVGVLVEDLRGVQELEEPPSPWKGAARAGVVEVARHAEGPVMVLGAGALLMDPRLIGAGGIQNG